MNREVKFVSIAILIIVVGSFGLQLGRSRTNPTLPLKVSSSGKPVFNKQQFSLTDPTSLWVVVNKQRPLSPLTFTPTDLQSVGNDQQVRGAAAQALLNLFHDAKMRDYNLIAESGFRSYDTQARVYASEVKSFGQTKADSESARPGHSEHQTGWAVDIAAPHCTEDCFGKTAASIWVKDNAYKYGFVLRYPSDKSDITGYRNEPWHFRYVGTVLAAELQKQNYPALETFFDLPAAPDYK